jgi:hypothetical protein
MSGDFNEILEGFSWKAEACRLFEDIARNTNLDTDERVLAWAKLKAWGNGRRYACCRVGDAKPERAVQFIVPLGAYLDDERHEAFLNTLIVATQQQCAVELDIPLRRVRTAMVHLVKRGILTTEWVSSEAWVTKYKLGVGFRAHLATKTLQAFCPVRLS